MVVPRWVATASDGTAAFFALKGQPYVSLGHSAATPQEASDQRGFSPERAAIFRGQCRVVPPFQGWVSAITRDPGRRCTAVPFRSALG